MSLSRVDRPPMPEAVLVRPLPVDLVATACSYADTHGVALPALWQAALLVVLHRYTDRTELTIGSGTAGVLRADLSGDPTFADLAARYPAPAEDPGEHLARLWIDPARPDRDDEAEDHGIGLDLAVALAATTDDGRVYLSVSCAPDRFDTGWAGRLVDHVIAALATGLSDPDLTIADIDFLPTAERHLVLHTWNPRPAPREPGLLHEVTAGHDPDRVAIRFRSVELTYGQLERHVNRLANAIAQAGIGPGHVVGLLLDRGLQLPVAQLAVMKAGAAWLPLDPQHPPARLGFQTADAGARLVLTTTDLDEQAGASAPHTPRWRLDDPREVARIAEHPDTPPNVTVHPDDPAYLLYTSGSTGRPKGVLVPHRCAYSYCQTAIEVFGTTADDRVAQASNPAFDASIFDCYATLLAGATLISAARETIAEPAAFANLVHAERVTLSFIPPAVLALLDPEEFAGGSLRALWSAGEALPPEQATRWPRPGLELHNAYGPTETTVVVTDYVCTNEPLTGPTPIGTALPNHRAYALDELLRPVPIGVPGQLYVAGTGVTYGYHDQPGLTAERFLADPYSNRPGERMYATGDLVRWRSDGVLEFLGRRDRQVQLRGQRVELGEIEHTLTQHPEVRQCAVVVRNGDQLVAYLAGEPDVDGVRGYLADRLPTYMIPTVFVTLPALPLTPNGKLDSARLPQPADPPATGYVAPRTDTECWLANCWQEVLGIERVGATDSFFDLGGDSLLAIQLVARIRMHRSVDLQPRHLFAHPVLEQLATHLDQADPVTLDEPIAPVPRTGPMPCTRQQEGLWFQHQLDPSSAAYHIGLRLWLRGELDVAALERAVHTLVVRHEALRTRFVNLDGRPMQVIDQPPPTPPLTLIDIHSADVEAWVRREIRRPMDLAADRLFRCPLARIATDEHVLLLVMHHIIADGWSARILGDELSRLYATETGAADEALTELALQPADHAVWQRAQLNGAELERQTAYWRDTLADLPTVDFPTDRPRPARRTGAGMTVTRRLPDDLTIAARAFSRTHRVSFLAVNQAALLTVLHRYTGQTDLPLGSIFSGRSRPDIEPLVGFFANPLVLRTDVSGRPTFAALVRRCHDTVLDAAAHQDAPFPLVVETLRPEWTDDVNPLFQISLSLQPPGASLPGLTLAEATAEAVDASTGYARFDLALAMIDLADGGLELQVEYSTELFDADRIDRLVDHVTTALTLGVATPDRRADEIDILPAAERERVLREWNPPATPAVTGLLHQVVDGHDADSVAIRFRSPRGDLEMTYAQLEEHANRLAHALGRTGIGGGQVVGLLLDRGPQLSVAQLAVMKAGASWTILDPQHPQVRLDFQAHDAAAALLLTTTDLAQQAPTRTRHWCLDAPDIRATVDACPATPPAVDIRPDDTAYLLYTSGSTGTPKGILVSHRSALGFCHTAMRQYAMSPADRVAQTANPAFDVSIFDCYATLFAGATLISAPGETFADPAAFAALLSDERVTVSYIPPAVLTLLDPRRMAGGSLRAVVSAGEVLPPELAARWSRPGLELHNAYGPTETTVLVTDYLCSGEASTGPTPIGAALPNHRLYVLDAALRPAPIGVPGQLYVAGTGVAIGYHGRRTLTAQRFLADPYSDSPGERMYATGDVVRWRSDGVLEYLGRGDRQVKLRGQRVELGEIEQTLARHPQVRACTVAVGDNGQLTAYLVGGPDLADLRRHLAAHLPTYMIPTAFVDLPALPLTPNGKLDPAKLPAPSVRPADHVAPGTRTERWLTETWREILGVAKVSTRDNIFDLGGNSLHITQLVARINDQFGQNVSSRDVFSTPTLEELATHLDQAGAPATPAPEGELDDEIADLERRLAERAELERLLEEKRAARTRRAAARQVVPVPRDGSLVCTHQQEGLWFEDQLDPSSSVYHIAFALRLRGTLDVPALGRALHALVVRHESLRTRFVSEGGQPRQVIDPPSDAQALSVIDLAAEAVEEWAAAEIRRPMDLAAGGLLRTPLARLRSDEHVLVLVVHHIVADGWSARILAGELTQLYAAEIGEVETQLPALAVHPADYAVWQRAWLDGGERERQLDFWRRTLSDLATVDIPTDRPRPAHPTGAGAGRERHLSDELALATRQYARERRVSFLALAQATLLIVLHRYTGQTDLPLGSIFSGRTRADTESMVGYFVNALVLRTRLDGEPSFDELVRRCHETVLEATAHQDVPFGLVVDALRPERVPGRNPLFQVNLSLQPPGAALGGLALDAITAESMPVTGSYARFDLAMAVVDSPDGRLELAVEYSTELFDADRIDRLLDHFATALAAGLSQPERPAAEIEVLPEAEHDSVLRAWNATAVEYGPEPLHHLFEESAARTPDAVAVIDHDGTHHTYRDLDIAANRLAHRLRGYGVGPDVAVGVCLPRGVNLVTTLLGVWKAGGAYVPLDPELPPERLTYMLTDVAAPVTVTQSAYASAFPTAIELDTAVADLRAEPSTTPHQGSTLDNAAYVLYTSGSTGAPKGVTVPHRGVHNRIAWMQEAYRLEPDDRVLQKTPYGFDVSVWEFFWPLVTGATVVLAAPGGHRDPEYLHRLIVEQGVTTLHFVPTMLRKFLDATSADGGLGRVRRVFCSGEALPADAARRFIAAWPDVELHNLYGPTEASIDVTAWRCEPDAKTVPIGRPIANIRTYVLDSQLRPVPIGVPGQLFLAGVGLAHGYHSQAQTTAEVFLADPHAVEPGQRMYATGDLVRWRQDGVLEYLGRTDRQVKLHGQRIELGEIEQALGQHPAVQQSAVIVRDNVLAGYIVGSADPADVRRFLADRLPTYMIPTTVVALLELPVTPNGKLDSSRLPEPAPSPKAAHAEPRTETERWLADVWRQLLQVERVGVEDSFFELGANSLHTTQLTARIRDQIGLHVHLRHVYASPTLGHLARYLDENAGAPDPASDPLVPLQPDGARPPLFLVHPVGGEVTHYMTLATMLGEDQPVHAIEDPELHGAAPADSLAVRAGRYLELIRRVQPRGPYHLGGWSLGGAVAVEMATQLMDAGEAVAVVLVLDADLPVAGQTPTDLEILTWFVLDAVGTAGAPLPDVDLGALRGLDRQTLDDLALHVLAEAGLAPPDTHDYLRTRMRAFAKNIEHYAAHRPRDYHGRLVLVTARENDETADVSAWKHRAPHLEHHTVSGDHFTMLRPPHVHDLAAILRRSLDKR